MPDPVFTAVIGGFIHEKPRSLSAKQYNKFPEEKQSEQVQRNQSHVSVEVKLPDAASLPIFIVHSTKHEVAAKESSHPKKYVHC